MEEIQDLLEQAKSQSNPSGEYEAYVAALRTITAELTNNPFQSGSIGKNDYLIECASMCLKKLKDLNAGKKEMLSPKSLSNKSPVNTSLSSHEIKITSPKTPILESPSATSLISSPAVISSPARSAGTLSSPERQTGGRFANNSLELRDLSSTIPLVPLSALSSAKQQLVSQMVNSQKRLDYVKSIQADGPQSLANIRNALENVEVLKERINQIDLQIHDSAQINILTVDPKHLAQQLTLLDLSIFQKINVAEELVDCKWTKPGSRTNCPNVSASIDLFNYVTNLIIFSIVNPVNVHERATAYQQFVRLAQYLSEMCNFNMLKAIITALSSPAVVKLKHTLALVPKKVTATYDGLLNMMSEERNYTYLRTVLSKRPTPAIPFLGLFLRDLYFIQEAQKTGIHLSGQGAQQVVSALDLLVFFQKSEYPFVTDIVLQHVILNQPFKTLNELYALSKEREPNMELEPNSSRTGTGGSRTHSPNRSSTYNPGSNAGPDLPPSYSEAHLNRPL